MDFELAEFALKKATTLGASYADVRLESTTANGFLLKNGVPQISGFDKISGLGLRLIINGTLGFVSTNELEKNKIKELIERSAKKLNSASKIGENVKLSEETTAVANYEVKQKVKLADISPKEKLDALFDIEKGIVKSGVDVPGRYLSLSDNVTEKYFVNSEGSKIFSKIPRVEYFYFLTIKNGEQTAQRYWQYGKTAGFEALKGWNLPETMTREVKAMQKNLQIGIKPPKGKIDVVAAPQVVGIMVHESGGHPYEADRIYGREAAQAGESFITKDMMGKRIGSDVVNVVDDPTLKNSYGYYLYDEEGVAARRKYMIKEGIMTELMHNRETANVIGLKSNGSARATSYDREAIVRMSNTLMLPGDHTEEELIEDVKLGIYMKNFMEWNIDDKRVHQKYVGAEAYLIKNGRIEGPVSKPILEMSTQMLYKSIDAVGKNSEYHAGSCGKAEPMQAIPVWFGGPSIRIKNVRLGE
ncbi:MAG: TldD/PmbA family protein [bacterium]|nr:TldD/PmbA family protein [bacterium]